MVGGVEVNPYVKTCGNSVVEICFEIWVERAAAVFCADTDKDEAAACFPNGVVVNVTLPLLNVDAKACIGSLVF